VERSRRDVVATRAAMRALEDGQLLGIFPEGRLAEGKTTIGPFQTGVAMMALRAGVGVYPAAVEGTMRDQGMLDAFLFPQRARVAFGQRVQLGEGEFSKEAVERATARIREAVERMHERTA
jgi:1-acyl-sn-glycerol-3-phosphate acyltransferase